VTEHRWRQALSRTRRGPFGKLAGLFRGAAVDPDFWQRLEAGLIQADLGLPLTSQLVERLQAEASQQGWRTPEQLLPALRQKLLDRLPPSPPETLPADGPLIIMLVGVNGSGKTTTAARLAHRWQQRGRTVLLAAADTHRAAASEQLAGWADRLAVPIVQGEPGSDPGAVVYNALQVAEAQSLEVVLVDTSGRMHTSHNLMGELAKLQRVAAKALPGAPHLVYLVLDATTGHNALNQARGFSQHVPLTATVLAKLDSSARGGMALAVAVELGLPVAYVGLGEAVDDLAPFEPTAYVNGLLSDIDGGSDQAARRAG